MVTIVSSTDSMRALLGLQHMDDASTHLHVSQGNTPCFLLGNVACELKKIAQVQVIPFTGGVRKLHGAIMPPHLTRVEVLEVTRGFKGWELSEHLEGSDVIMILGQCMNKLLRWLKTDIEVIQVPTPSAHDHDPTFAGLDPLIDLAETMDILQDMPLATHEDHPTITLLARDVGVAEDAMAGQSNKKSKEGKAISEEMTGH